MAIVVSTGARKAPPSSADQRKNRRQARVLVESGIVAVALGFGLMLRVLACEGVMITSGSMEPTIDTGDYTLVDHRVALRGTWQRGDVIVFDSPPSWRGDKATLVKRIIGLPGEKVALLSGRVLINDRYLNERYFKELPDPEDIEPIMLGRDEYYVMGDNRNNSDDSRDNGPVAESNIRGRVLQRLWPFSHFGALKAPDYESLKQIARN